MCLGRCNQLLPPEASSREEPVEQPLGVPQGSVLLPVGHTADGLLPVAREGIGQVAARVANTDATKRPEKGTVGPSLAVRAGGGVKQIGGIAEPPVGPGVSSAAESAAAAPDIAAGSAERRTEQGWLEAWDRDECSEVKSTGRLGSRASFPGFGRKSAAEGRSERGPRACGLGIAVVLCSPRLPD